MLIGIFAVYLLNPVRRGGKEGREREGGGRRKREGREEEGRTKGGRE